MYNNPVYVAIDGRSDVFAHTGTKWMQADPLLDQPITIDQISANPNGKFQMLIF